MIKEKVKTTKTYFADPHSRYNNNDAEIIGQRFNELEHISIDTVLKDAKLKKSPLHEYFEWDDSIAAIKHRREQASKMITSIKVTIIRDDTDADLKGFHPIIIFHKDTQEKEKEFIAVDKILDDDEYSKQLMDSADVELLTWYHKWIEYGKVYPLMRGRYKKIFEAISQIL